MGFFSSSEEKTVFANTCHLSEVSTNEIQDAVLYAILSGKNIASTIYNTTTNRLSRSAESFRTYAKDSYTLGLPEVTYTASTVLSEEDVAAAIAEDTSRPYGVVLDFHYVAPLIPLLVVAPFLFSVRGWDPVSNLITVLPPEYQPWSSLHYEGTVYDISLNEDYTVATITYQVTQYILKYSGDRETPKEDRKVSRDTRGVYYFTDTQAMPSGLYYGRSYCVASYRVLDSEGSPSTDTYWWYYDIGSKLYPSLIPENTIDEENNLFPIVPIRWKNESMVREEVQDTDLYKTSKKLLRKFGLDIDTLASKLEENPDIGEIDHAYVVLGVDLQTEEIASIRYLAEFFDQISDKGQASLFSHLQDLFTHTTSNSLDFFGMSTLKYAYGTEVDALQASNEVAWSASDGSSTAVKVLVNDSLGDFEEYGLHIEISYNYIRSEIIQGVIGEIGHATKEWSYTDTAISWFHNKNIYDDATVIFKVQVAANAYKQVSVKGLTLINHVCKNHYYVTTLSDVINNPDEHNLIVPLHYNLTKKIPSEIRNQLYQDALLLVMNSVVVTSVAWYQTGFFKFIVMAVSMVIAAYTGQAWLIALTEAAEAGAMAVLMFVLKSLLIAVAVSQVLNYVAEWVGPEVMALLSVAVIAIAGAAKLGAFDGIAALSAYMPTAGKLLAFSGSMLSSASNAYGSAIEDLHEEYDALTEKHEKLLEELNDYYDLLEEPTEEAINLLEAQAYSQTLKQPRVNNPEEFYDLAIHTGNIGTLALQSPALFHNIALTLPKPDSLLVG